MNERAAYAIRTCASFMISATYLSFVSLMPFDSSKLRLAVGIAAFLPISIGFAVSGWLNHY